MRDNACFCWECHDIRSKSDSLFSNSGSNAWIQDSKIQHIIHVKSNQVKVTVQSSPGYITSAFFQLSLQLFYFASHFFPWLPRLLCEASLLCPILSGIYLEPLTCVFLPRLRLISITHCGVLKDRHPHTFGPVYAELICLIAQRMPFEKQSMSFGTDLSSLGMLALQCKMSLAWCEANSKEKVFTHTCLV
jgi:hypothetical protein